MQAGEAAFVDIRVGKLFHRCRWSEAVSRSGTGTPGRQEISLLDKWEAKLEEAYIIDMWIRRHDGVALRPTKGGGGDFILGAE